MKNLTNKSRNRLGQSKSDSTIAEGFTIVELLIVIVVVGILAAISIVSYQGIQQRARDTQRSNDMAVITKALELYYTENGKYPDSSGSTLINGSWSNSSEAASWKVLEDALVPKYISALPKDPVNSSNYPLGANAGSYSYYSTVGVSAQYCNAGLRQAYRITYRLESRAQEDKSLEGCSTITANAYGAVSEFVTAKL